MIWKLKLSGFAEFIRITKINCWFKWIRLTEGTWISEFIRDCKWFRSGKFNWICKIYQIKKTLMFHWIQESLKSCWNMKKNVKEWNHLKQWMQQRMKSLAFLKIGLNLKIVLTLKSSLMMENFLNQKNHLIEKTFLNKWIWLNL